MALAATHLDVIGYFVNDVDVIFGEKHGLLHSCGFWLEKMDE